MGKDVIDDTLELIQKKYSGRVKKASDSKIVITSPERSYSFGSKVVNYQLSGNVNVGVPWGKIIEIYGLEGTFKTTLLFQLFKDVQEQGKQVAYIDAERNWQPELAQAVGLDLSKVILLENETAEEHFNMVLDLVKNGKQLNLGMIGVDSIDALEAETVKNSEIGDAEMANLARIMGQGLRKLKDALYHRDVSVIYINQVRDKIGVVFGSPKTRRGGKAMRFYAWLNIEIKSTSSEADEVKDLTDEKIKTGAWVTVEANKSKQFPPHRKARFYGVYGKGIDLYYDLVNACVMFGILNKREKKIEIVKKDKGKVVYSLEKALGVKLDSKESQVTIKKFKKWLTENRDGLKDKLEQELKKKNEEMKTVEV